MQFTCCAGCGRQHNMHQRHKRPRYFRGKPLACMQLTCVLHPHLADSIALVVLRRWPHVVAACLMHSLLSVVIILCAFIIYSTFSVWHLLYIVCALIVLLQSKWACSCPAALLHDIHVLAQPNRICTETCCLSMLCQYIAQCTVNTVNTEDCVYVLWC